MKDKPEIADAILMDVLQEAYGIQAKSLEFLPLGYDALAGVYRVHADEDYFLKAKRKGLSPASLAVPYFLKNHGIEQIVAPIPTKSGELSIQREGFTLILYPFIEGDSGMQVGLSDKQWLEYGAVLKAMHSIHVPDELVTMLHKETFIPKQDDLLQSVWEAAEKETFSLPCQRELAAFINQRREEIIRFKLRGRELGQMLQEKNLPFVLAHADIHTANIMIGTDGKLHVVDWDEVQLAPKERDLMFLTGNSIDGRTKAQEALFFEGYGSSDYDKLAMAYYRYDWGVQDMGEFGREVFFLDFFSEAAKAHAAEMFMGLFAAGNTIDAAYEAEKML